MKTKTKNIILATFILIVLSAGLYSLYILKLTNQTFSYNNTESIQPSAEKFINGTANMMWEINPGDKNEAQLATANLPPIKAICGGINANSFDCYGDYYRDFIKTSGISEALSDLKQRYLSNSYLANVCHPIMHIFGNTATEIYPTVAEAYQHGDNFCYAGYYHGVLESYVAKISKGDLVSQMNEICKDVSDKSIYGINYYNCMHGLGHGVMAYTSDELFEALDLCDILQGDWEKSSCYSGVFMENVIIDNKYHFSKYLKPSSDLLYPCNAVDAKYKGACYLIHTGYLLKYNKEDFSKVFDLCSGADSDFKGICYQSIGRDASGFNTADVSKTKALCNLGKDFDQRSNCIIGAVKDFIYRFEDIKQGEELCNALDSDLKKVCLDTATEFYKTF